MIKYLPTFRNLNVRAEVSVSKRNTLNQEAGALAQNQPRFDDWKFNISPHLMIHGFNFSVLKTKLKFSIEAFVLL